MKSWNTRPIEVANLLNPAFTTVLLSEAVRGFRESRQEGMPYPLCFLVLPIVLPKAIRDALPRTVSTRMHVWLQRNPELRIRFADQARQMVPYTKESLVFAAQLDALQINDGGLLREGRRCPSPTRLETNSELVGMAKQARFVGRWLAQAGTPTTIYIMWGLQP